MNQLYKTYAQTYNIYKRYNPNMLSDKYDSVNEFTPSIEIIAKTTQLEISISEMTFYIKCYNCDTTHNMDNVQDLEHDGDICGTCPNCKKNTIFFESLEDGTPIEEFNNIDTLQ